MRPFDLGKDRLSRFEIYKTTDGDYYFSDIHHLVIDDTAHHKLAENIGLAYNGEKILPEKYDFCTLSEAEYALRDSEAFTAAKKFYDELLNDCAPDCLPAPDVHSETPEEGHFTVSFKLDPDVFSQLRHSVGISTTAFFTAIMGYLIAEYNYSDKSVIATVFSDRNEKNAATIASIVKTMPFVTKLEGENSVREFLKKQNDQLMQSRRNSIYGLSDAHKDHGITSAINFAFQGRLHEYELARGLDIKTERIYDSKHIESTALIFELSETGKGEYCLEISYRADSFSERFIELMADAFVQTAREFLVKESLSDIQVTDKKALALTEKFNQTEKAYDADKTIVGMFREQAKANPDNTAVVYLDKRYTYKQVDEISDRISGYISSLGIGREDVVSILIPRCEYMAIASLGA